MSSGIMGSGDFAYRAQDGWAKWPDGWDSGDVAALDGFVQLSTDDLNGIGAASLLIGNGGHQAGEDRRGFEDE